MSAMDRALSDLRRQRQVWVASLSNDRKVLEAAKENVARNEEAIAEYDRAIQLLEEEGCP